MSNNPTGDRFVAAIAELQKEHGLRDDQAAAALMGIVINLCRRTGNDPRGFAEWAILAAERSAERRSM